MNKKIIIEQTQKILQFESIFPHCEQVIDWLFHLMQSYGFNCKKFNVNNCSHLYAEIGLSDNIIAFAGHVDVVPTGNNWNYDPFAATIKNNKIYARGAVDMKPAIIAALHAILVLHQENKQQKYALIIAGDEEVSPSLGTKHIINWVNEQNKKIDFCIVGEPTNPNKMGEMIKIGRRGSINFKLKLKGKQGHVAYPLNAFNPFNYTGKIITALNDIQFDQGNEFFSATNLEITGISSNTNTENIIPGEVEINFNIRFNNKFSEQSLINLIHSILESHLPSEQYDLKFSCSAHPFLTEEKNFTKKILKILSQHHQINTVASTEGGTSDARYIAPFFPTIEYGLINKTAHQTDEYVDIDDLIDLFISYTKIFNLMF